MTTRRFLQLDVFSPRAGAGNPLAVVLDAEGLDDASMQAIARWTRLPETTFVFPPQVAGASYRLRMFSPQKEVPFAGHPSVGTAHAVLQAGLATPIDGVLVERRMSPGMAVSPDSEQPLAVIGDPDRLWLLLDVPESLAGRLQAGMQVTVPGADGQPLQATLQHVDDFVDSERRVVQARAELDNRARGFKAGQYVRAQVALPAEGGVSLPDAAVLLIDGKQVVFVEEGKGRFVRHAVHAEELGDGRLWVREGLATGARVVVEGGLLLQQLADSAPATASIGTGHAAP